MKKVLLFLLAGLMFLWGCNDVNSPKSSSLGNAEVSLSIGKIGNLAKLNAINLATANVTVSSVGEVSQTEVVDLSGSSAADVVVKFKDLKSLKDWTVYAETKDVNNVVIHKGSSVFHVDPAKTSDVVLNITAEYSTLTGRIYPILDSVTKCQLIVDNTLIQNEIFTKQTRLGDTVLLNFDYLTTGNNHLIKMDVYGEMWGIDTLLYTGETNLSIIAGADQNYSMKLKWVGPKTPPNGKSTITLNIGNIGSIGVDGILEKNSTVFTNDENTIALWDFTKEENEVLDLTKNGNNGNKFNTVIGESSAVFSGNSNSYAEFPSLDNLLRANNKITIESRLKLKSFPNGGYNLGCIAGYADWNSGVKTMGYELRVKSNGTVEFLLGFEGSVYKWVQATTQQALLLDTWYDIAAQFDGENVTIYINGVQSVKVANVASMSFSDRLFRVAKRGAGTPDLSLNAEIKEIAVSKIARYIVE